MSMITAGPWALSLLVLLRYDLPPSASYLSFPFSGCRLGTNGLCFKTMSERRMQGCECDSKLLPPLRKLMTYVTLGCCDVFGLSYSLTAIPTVTGKINYSLTLHLMVAKPKELKLVILTVLYKVHKTWINS